LPTKGHGVGPGGGGGRGRWWRWCIAVLRPLRVIRRRVRRHRAMVTPETSRQGRTPMGGIQMVSLMMPDTEHQAGGEIR